MTQTVSPNCLQEKPAGDAFLKKQRNRRLFALNRTGQYPQALTALLSGSRGGARAALVSSTARSGVTLDAAPVGRIDLAMPAGATRA